MSTTRQNVKNAIKSVVQNTVGIKMVSTFRPKLIQQTNFPSIVITLPSSKEERLTGGAPHGKKLIVYRAQLEIAMIDTTNDGSGMLTFDALLDAVDDQLRLDPTMGGQVLGATIDYINTTVTTPQLVGNNIAYLGIKAFDVTVQVAG